MRRAWVIARVAILSAAATVAPIASAAAAPAPGVVPIPVIQVDGRGYGHGVGMAQDGALAMGRAGATTKQILGQFYPGTTIGKMAGSVRVPVLDGNAVELTFPDGGEVRGNLAQNSPPAAVPLKVAPGGTALVYREGDNTRIKTAETTSSATTSSSSTSSPTTSTTTTQPTPTITTTTLIPLSPARRDNKQSVGVSSTTSTTRSTTSTSVGAQQTVALFSGVVIAAPRGDGRVGVTPRNHRYRGVIEIAPVAGANAVRFTNQVPVETYLRGMGEVRSPSWPAPSLQSQAIAARTYALRAMAAGGELCDTQRCQVYLGADAEYTAMDKAVSATAGQVLLFGKGLASAVYSANGGGYSASREEGFGLTGPNYPYLRAAPYPSDDPGAWSVVIALRDVASRLNYRGEITSVDVADRGPSGRATNVTLRGPGGAITVTGIAFDAALGLRSTLFTLRVTTATKVDALTGGSVLQAPPEEAVSLPDGNEAAASTLDPKAFAPPVRVVNGRGVGAAGPLAAALLVGVTVAAFTTRRRTRDAWHAMLS